jgi:hypothetical protein
VLSARGRDTPHVAISTTFGPDAPSSFEACTDEIGR